MIRRFFFLGLGCLVPIGMVIAYYASIDGLPDLMFLLRYQAYYLRGHDLYVPQVLGQVAIVVVSQAPFLLLSGWQVIRLARQRLLTRDVFLLWFLVFSVSPFFIGGHYFSHYFVQAIPALVLLATEALASPAAQPDGGSAPFPSAGARIRRDQRRGVLSNQHRLLQSGAGRPSQSGAGALHPTAHDAGRLALSMDMAKKRLVRGPPGLRHTVSVKRISDGPPLRHPTSPADGDARVGRRSRGFRTVAGAAR
jgi:hypothetical protein